ncbi:MAG: hypothetical protein HOV80_05370 [Polyangiaceae bacterium]|nr:hypothetical protein [Polyangiaceae bacterium]
MSPEQARGEPLDPRADVFAAGIILWELVAGRRLYRAEGDEPLLEVARRAAVRPLPESDLPSFDELRALIGRALAADRTERFATAGDMAAAIDEYAARSGLRANARALRRFLEQSFAPDVIASRRRRELATRAMAGGPLAVLEILDVPIIGMVPPEAIEPPIESEPASAKSKKRKKRKGSKSPIPSSVAPVSAPISSAAPSSAVREEHGFSRSAITLLCISSILIAYLVMRAFQG